MYNSELRDGVPSQTMVGVAEGERNVNVSMHIGLEVAVSDNVYTTKRVWRTEVNLPTPTPTPTPTPPIELPETGDHSNVESWLLMLGCSFLMLLGLVVRSRRLRA